MFSLKEMFENQVVVSLDESWNKPWPGGKTEEDKPWCYEIVGKRGTIYPSSESHICVRTTSRIGARLLKLFKADAALINRGDTEWTIRLPLALTRSVFRYIKPTRKRQLSPEQKEVLTQRLRASRLP